MRRSDGSRLEIRKAYILAGELDIDHRTALKFLRGGSVLPALRGQLEASLKRLEATGLQLNKGTPVSAGVLRPVA